MRASLHLGVDIDHVASWPEREATVAELGVAVGRRPAPLVRGRARAKA